MYAVYQRPVHNFPCQFPPFYPEYWVGWGGGGGGGDWTERQNIAVFKVGDYALGKLKFWFYFTKMCCSLYCVDIPPPLWG